MPYILMPQSSDALEPADGAAPDDVERAGPRSISAADSLREAILTGELASGARINEVHVARALGISRTPTRAALHALAAEGLVDYAHNRGFMVREFSPEAVHEAYEIRANLEGLACRFAAERGVPEDLRTAMEQALQAGDAILQNPEFGPDALAAYRRVNVAFHDAIMGAANNRMLAEAVRLTLNMPGASYRHIVAFNHTDVRRRHDDHHRLFVLITQGEGWRAELLMREHVLGLATRNRQKITAAPADETSA